MRLLRDRRAQQKQEEGKRQKASERASERKRENGRQTDREGVSKRQTYRQRQKQNQREQNTARETEKPSAVTKNGVWHFFKKTLPPFKASWAGHGTRQKLASHTSSCPC